jgi:hypothetical protein
LGGRRASFHKSYSSANAIRAVCLRGMAADGRRFKSESCKQEFSTAANHRTEKEPSTPRLKRLHAGDPKINWTTSTNSGMLVTLQLALVTGIAPSFPTTEYSSLIHSTRPRASEEFHHLQVATPNDSSANHRPRRGAPNARSLESPPSNDQRSSTTMSRIASLTWCSASAVFRIACGNLRFE